MHGEEMERGIGGAMSGDEERQLRKWRKSETDKREDEV